MEGKMAGFNGEGRAGGRNAPGRFGLVGRWVWREEYHDLGTNEHRHQLVELGEALKSNILLALRRQKKLYQKPIRRPHSLSTVLDYDPDPVLSFHRYLDALTVNVATLPTSRILSTDAYSSPISFIITPELVSGGIDALSKTCSGCR
ncbi:hypothetical protein AAF712_016077 [Marasmius tenuissimus]|uniref:Uncharacterized protein n=1 Tax=Marasmius tenuissimus TaxID=585030 RepID=A0ABR2Z8V6_9AGAR